MLSTCGICVDAWVRVDGGCAIEYEVIGDEAYFRVGSRRADGLTLILDAKALEAFLATAGHAWHELQAVDAPGPAAP